MTMEMGCGPETLRELLKVCADFGVRKLTLGGLQVEIADKMLDAPVLVPTAPNFTSEPEPTEEDILFWSSGDVQRNTANTKSAATENR